MCCNITTKTSAGFCLPPLPKLHYCFQEYCNTATCPGVTLSPRFSHLDRIIAKI